MRRAILEFSRTLDQLEAERLRIANKCRPAGLPPVGALSEAGPKVAALR
jgi:hypothetical protein